MVMSDERLWRLYIKSQIIAQLTGIGQEWDLQEWEKLINIPAKIKNDPVPIYI